MGQLVAHTLGMLQITGKTAKMQSERENAEHEDDQREKNTLRIF